MRPWLVDGPSGGWIDLMDNRPFSTEFSHTRFLVPALSNYKGWALFMDSDMIFLSDIEDLFALCDDKYAVMVYKHIHKPTPGDTKMDGRIQSPYFRKNWSSFMLINCGHLANRYLTKERVNTMSGADLHAFSWLDDRDIGSLPNGYNYIVGVSPKLPVQMSGRPQVLHYTEGGPWFDECKDVPYAGLWIDEYEDLQKNWGGMIAPVPTIIYEGAV